jgi:hypothetical protein
MTDPNPPVTEVDEIIVTGQRARGPSPYADLQYPTKGAGFGSGEQQEEVGDDGLGGGGLSDEQEQCANPEGRRQWNADARAQQAIQEFRDRAGLLNERDLQNREFGALICDMGNGNVVLGEIQVGDPILDAQGQPITYPGGRPTVAIPHDGCGGGTAVGFVHSHPGNASFTPSADDFDYADWHVNHNQAPENFGVYVVSMHPDPANPSRPTYRVSRSERSERQAAASGTLEPGWVNPDASPCPGSQP